MERPLNKGKKIIMESSKKKKKMKRIMPIALAPVSGSYGPHIVDPSCDALVMGNCICLSIIYRIK